MIQTKEFAMVNNKIKVILVDTHENVRNSFRNLLEKERDIEVVAEVKNVTLYIQHAVMLKPDVFVLNMNLSGINICHTISYIIASIPDTKVLVVSFYSNSLFVLRTLYAGASGYMLEDHAYEELALAIRTVVSNHMYVSPGIAGIVKE